jgi:hypothetical protein
MTVHGVLRSSAHDRDERRRDACTRLLKHCTTDLGYCMQVSANRRLSSVEHHIQSPHFLYHYADKGYRAFIAGPPSRA